MKRTIKKKYQYGICTEFTLFMWLKCSCCGKEFRREKGFSFVGGPFQNMIGKVYYVCGVCVPTKEKAHEYALSGEWAPKLGPPPPAPPPPPPAKKP